MNTQNPPIPPKIEIGDLVTGYHVGYHKVTDVQGTLISYTRVDGNRKSKNKCSAFYCVKINPDELYDQMVKEAADLREQLLKAMS